jgi:8-oxo-dGTP diphosphatase
MSIEDRPKIGVGIMVMKDGLLLLGKRRNSHGEGEWALVGGKLEYQEAIADCARREIREEAGIEIENIRFGAVINSLRYLPKHFVSIGLVADWKSGELQIFPDEKISAWQWVDPKHLPEPMFYDSLQLITATLDGTRFRDSQ